jgi:hypothetical protein
MTASKHRQKKSGSTSYPQDPTVASAIADAFLKCTYGKRYSTAPEAYDLASRIKYARLLPTLPQRFNTSALNRRIRNRMDQLAQRLLTLAIRSAKELRLVADALDKEQAQDPRQANIIVAYLACVRLMNGPPPTLADLQTKFVEMFGEQCWPQPEFSVRKTLKVLGLPLAKAKRGRPPRAGSKKRRRRSTYSTKRFVILKLATQGG